MLVCELCGCTTLREPICPACRDTYTALGKLINLLGYNVQVSFEQDEDAPWTVQINNSYDKFEVLYKETGKNLADVIDLILIKRRDDK